ncbi:MAG: hypothetical protein KDA86_06725 [Planctomycetaceae bacterium]|nr:hypothetical protein [Planctomycetaceae bacterium]
MGKPTGFKEFPRQTAIMRDAHKRIGDWDEFIQPSDILSSQHTYRFVRLLRPATMEQC